MINLEDLQVGFRSDSILWCTNLNKLWESKSVPGTRLVRTKCVSGLFIIIKYKIYNFEVPCLIFGQSCLVVLLSWMHWDNCGCKYIYIYNYVQTRYCQRVVLFALMLIYLDIYLRIHTLHTVFFFLLMYLHTHTHDI